MRLIWIAFAVVLGFFWRLMGRPAPQSTRGKVVIVTGASSGIGAVTAVEFAKGGAHVVLAARRIKKLREVAQQLQHYDIETLVVEADVSKDEDLEALIQQTLDKFGRIDVLVNNAGVAYSGRLTEHTPEQIQQLLNVNFYGAIRLTQLVLPTMLHQNSGHIINITSVAGLIKSPGQPVYSATKAGLNAFSDSLRREVMGSGVRVSTVLPGFTYTPMVGEEKGTPQDVENALRKGGLFLPGTVLDKPETVAETIVDVYRHYRRSAIMGGTMVQLGLSSNAFPDIADQTYKFMNVDKMIETMKKWI